MRVANDAWAVGGAGNENWIIRWNGTAWNTVSSPRPDPDDDDNLRSVSAISANDAWAVGNYLDWLPDHTFRTLTMHWDGVAWSAIPSPTGGFDTTLRSVSARASNDVWAVGRSSTNEFNTYSQPLAIHWNGTGWITTPMQNPGEWSGLNAVHARAANDVWAVGSRASYESQQPIIYHWNGSQWSGQIGGQGLRQGTLYSVVALAANDVWAVGVPIDGAGTPRPWVLRFDGQSWREDTTIPQEVDPVQLYGVSASSATNVWAVGRTEGRVLRYHWNGSSWTRYSTPDPSPQGERHLLAVDALGASDAWTVGYEIPNSDEYPYMERFSNACPPPTITPTRTATGIVNTPTPTPIGYIVIPGTATIVPGTNLVPGSQCNDCTAIVNFPFRARLYDGVFSSARVGSNGTLGYLGNVNPSTNNCLPSSAFNYAILPHWDDLDTSSRTACNGPCGIYTSISGAASSRIFNIEWRATLRGGSRFVNFEVRVYENQNRTDLVYGALDHLSSHTIAAQRDTGSQVTRIYCDSGFGPEYGSSPERPDEWIVQPGMMLSLVQPAGEPTPTPTICPLQFTDVPPDHTFYPFIRCLACQGILSGYADGTFLPGNDVTRGQLAKIVSNASGFIEDVEGQTFSDVPPDHTFYDYVERIAVRGIISGYSDGTFRPQNNATRGQIAKIVANAASFSEPITGQTFSDVPPDHTFYEFIERMAQRNIIGGYSDGTFRPQNNATRGQTAKIVANTFFPGCQTP